LFSVLENDPTRQIAFYHPGLGTMEAAAALTSTARKVTKLLGLAIGYGLERDVRDTYVFLMAIITNAVAHERVGHTCSSGGLHAELLHLCRPWKSWWGGCATTTIYRASVMVALMSCATGAPLEHYGGATHGGASGPPPSGLALGVAQPIATV
jgi:hypothetical protein